MEFVPLDFCESVCAILKSLANLELLCSENTDCDFWTYAIKNDMEKRPKITLEVGDFGYSCASRYRLNYASGENISFSQFQAASQEQHFCLEKFTTRSSFAFSGRRAGRQEMEQLIEMIAPYTYKTDFELLREHLKEDFLAKILTICRDCSLLKIHMNIQLDSLYAATVEGFLRVQLKSGHLKELKLMGYCPESFRKEIEQFALRGTFHKLEIPNTLFRFDFLQKLVEKRLNGDQEWFFVGRFYEFWKYNGKLEKLNRSILGASERWKTTDGVTVSVKLINISNQIYQISLAHE